MGIIGKITGKLAEQGDIIPGLGPEHDTGAREITAAERQHGGWSQMDQQLMDARNGHAVEQMTTATGRTATMYNTSRSHVATPSKQADREAGA